MKRNQIAASATLVVALVIFGFYFLRGSIAISIENRTPSSLHITQMRVGNSKKTFDRVVPSNASIRAFTDESTFVLQDDRLSKSLEVTLGEGATLSCMIKNKSYMGSCSLKASISAGNSMQCSCDGENDFNKN